MGKNGLFRFIRRQNSGIILRLKINIMTKIKNKTKSDLNSLLNSLDYLTPLQKAEWFKICENLNDAELQKVYASFEADQQNEDEFKLDLISKTGLGDLYKTKIKEISAKYQASARKKSEAYITQNEEKAEDILNKLNDV